MSKLTFLSVIIVGLVSSCMSMGPAKEAKNPLDISEYLVTSDTYQKTAIVFLPGLGDEPKDFETNNFVSYTQSQMKADIYIPDAHIAYYEKATILERLRADLFDKLKSRNYEKVWVFGISMGGGGSLLSLKEWGREFAGVVLIAPFLGDAPLFDEVNAAGGAVAWKPENNKKVLTPREVTFRNAWVWLKNEGSSGRQPNLYLAYGLSDRFVVAHKLFAPLVDPNKVITIQGGHNWKTWFELLKLILPKLQ